MITATYLSRGFSSFWLQLTPWLNNYVNYLNKGGLQRIDTPLFSNDSPSFRAINNTVAFYKFIELHLTPDCSEDLSNAMNKAFLFLKKLPRNNLDDYKLTNENIEIITQQARRIFYKYRNVNIIANPIFPGCGLILNAEGDFYYQDTLVEIKAGERNLYPSDIKQLIVYGALNYINKNGYPIKKFELFNPRQGIFYSESIENIGLSVSDKSIEEIFTEVCVFADNYGLLSN